MVVMSRLSRSIDYCSEIFNNKNSPLGSIPDLKVGVLNSLQISNEIFNNDLGQTTSDFTEKE